MRQHTENIRTKIIQAAEDLVIELGARHLTIDAVAEKAGMSKGGFLYHFPSKEALLMAMLERRVARREERRQKELSGSVNELTAHVLSSLEDDERLRKLSAALLAAVAHDPQLLAPYRKEYRKFIERSINKGIPLEKVAVILLAADGLTLLEVLSMSPFTPFERKKIVKEIISLSQETQDNPQKKQRRGRMSAHPKNDG